MSLIARLRKLEGIGIETQRTELTTLIHQSLKDSEQELEVYRTDSSGCICGWVDCD